MERRGQRSFRRKSAVSLSQGNLVLFLRLGSAGFIALAHDVDRGRDDSHENRPAQNAERLFRRAGPEIPEAGRSVGTASRKLVTGGIGEITRAPWQGVASGMGHQIRHVLAEVGNILPHTREQSGGAIVVKWKMDHGSGVDASSHLSRDSGSAQVVLPRSPPIFKPPGSSRGRADSPPFPPSGCGRPARSAPASPSPGSSFPPGPPESHKPPMDRPAFC